MKDSSTGVPMKTMQAGSRSFGQFHKGISIAYATFLLGAALIAICFINPVREMATEDDGWAYARVVKELLETGEYRLSPWAAPNMPTQIYLAAGMSKLFGYSLTTLRFSTLLLLGVACLSFYRLLREFRCDIATAATLTFALFCSPFVLLLGFTFNTDVHFIGWLLLALFLYVRAIHLNHLALMLLGSAAAAGAIGVRQFGVAVLGGLFVAWVLTRGSRLRAAPFFLSGALLPAAAAAWQLRAGLEATGFTQAVLLCVESRFLRQGMPRLLAELIWRPTVILEYASLYLLPLMPALLFLIGAFWRQAGFVGDPHLNRTDGPSAEQQRNTRRRALVVRLVFWVSFACLGIVFAAITRQAEGERIIRQPLMPSIPWIGELYLEHFHGRTALLLSWVTTIFAITGGAVLGWLLTIRVPVQVWRWRLSPSMALVVTTGLLILGEHITFVVLNDTYVTAVLPFMLFVFAILLRDVGWPRGSVIVSGLSLLAFLSVFSVFLRLEFGRLEARWTAAQAAVAAGVDPSQINGGYHWALYHGAFDRWVAEVGSRKPAKAYCNSMSVYLVQNAFDDWLNERMKDVPYAVETANTPPTCPRCGPAVLYRDLRLARRYAYYAPNPQRE